MSGDSCGLEDLLRDARARAWLEPVFCGILSMMCAVSVRGRGNLEEVESSGSAFVVAPNHSRFLDGFVMGSVAPSLDFALAKEECWLNGFHRMFIRGLGGIPSVRRGRLAALKARYPGSYSRFITDDGRFRYEMYVPSCRSEEILEDISRAVGVYHDPKTGARRQVLSLSDLNAGVIAQYLLLRDRRLLIFPQGTRSKGLADNVRYGLYNILFDLAVCHGKDVPVLPCAIRYGARRLVRRDVEVSFGRPRFVAPYLVMAPSDRHMRFMSDLMGDILSLAQY